jgi:hypothetical protein
MRDMPEKHAYETVVYGRCTYEKHAYERCTPVRGTPCVRLQCSIASATPFNTKAINLIAWLDILSQQFSSIRQWAFDTLSCPATSCECERAFSSAKSLITPDLNALSDDLIEALECLKA